MNKSAHILIVDDEPDTIEILSRQLGIENYKILKAYSGKESLELLKKHKVDLILMDIIMPEMDGFETIRIIRDTVKEFIPIIIVTASKDDTESITRGFAVGANDYIVIPCNKEELLARIKAMLRIKELHDALEEKNQKLTEANEQIEATHKELIATAEIARKRATELEKAYKKLDESQASLIRSEKLAVMGRLTADVAHELNNPLAIVIGGAQLILSRLDEKQTSSKSLLETVLRNARRCKTILSSLLGYNQTIGKKEENINLPDLIREAINDIGFQYDMSAIDVEWRYPGFAKGSAEASDKQAYLETVGNKSALLSVFVNLIRNARQAMGEKGRLTIAVAKEDKKHLRVEIHDTGIGMNKEQKAKLFQPFASGWKEKDGSGIGLATSLGIIETHGGSMSAESEGIGKGATFTILLPCEFARRSQ